MAKSISELLGKEWPPLGSNASHFHKRIHEAVTKPLDSLISWCSFPKISGSRS